MSGVANEANPCSRAASWETIGGSRLAVARSKVTLTPLNPATGNGRQTEIRERGRWGRKLWRFHGFSRFIGQVLVNSVDTGNKME